MNSNVRAALESLLRIGNVGIANAGAVILIIVSLVGHVTAAEEDGHSVTRADTSSPRATLKSFIDSCNEFHQLTTADRHFDRRSPYHRPSVRRVLDCLDTSELPDYARDEIAAEAAACLKEVLDRVPLSIEEAPDAEAIKAAGGPENLIRWDIPGTRLTIARVEEGPQKHEYLFTPGTVGRAVQYYEEIEHLDYRKKGPEVSRGFYRWYSTAPGHPMLARMVANVLVCGLDRH